MSEPIRESLAKWAWIAIACVLFGPFAIIYFLGFLGQSMPEGAFFEIWFMGALTVSGVIATINFAGSVRDHGIRELGCVLPIAAVTCYWGYLFLRMIGFLE